MKASKAISILKRQISNLATQTNYGDPTWIIQTRSLIEEIFGKGSREEIYIHEFNYLDFHVGNHQWDGNFVKNKAQAVKFLENCIQTIEDKGVHRKPAFHGLSGKEIGTVATIIVAVLGGVSWLSYNTGVNNQTKEAYATEVRNGTLIRDSATLAERIKTLEKEVIKLSSRLSISGSNGFVSPNFNPNSLDTAMLNKIGDGSKITK
ncbi:hypothetical protein [Flavitalea sp.]|nr:hypothetical protein [Flavitalea sp.]